METLGKLAATMDRGHEDAGGMINDISDVITKNHDAIDSPRAPPFTLCAHAMVLCTIGASSHKMTMLQPLFNNSTIVLSMRPYAHIRGLDLLLQFGGPVAVGTYIGTMWSLAFDTEEPIEPNQPGSGSHAWSGRKAGKERKEKTKQARSGCKERQALVGLDGGIEVFTTTEQLSILPGMPEKITYVSSAK
eukprot:1137710-Pelagomonas_calceolata.AAC.4